MISDRRKAARIFGLIVGAAVGIETLFTDAMCCGGTLAGILFMFTLSGMLASAMIVGNIHNSPTWIAALANVLLYFFLGSSVWKFVTFVASRTKRNNSN
jgi:hypothetical protein